MKPLVSLVITSYNDREIIRPYFEAISKTLSTQTQYAWEIIYVDDGSTDGSVGILESLASQQANVAFIELTRNFGQQKAFLAGMRHAGGDAVITLDGDFQYPPECLVALAQKVFENNDIVSGIRTKRQDPWFTRLTSAAAQFFIRRIFRIPVRDFGAVKAFGRFLVDQILKYENYSTNVYGLAYSLTNRHAEIPVGHLPRFAGRSKWNFTKRLHLHLDMYLAYSPYENTSLLKIGFFSTALGLLILSLLLYLFLFHGIFFFRSFTAVFALCLTGGGSALMLGSLFLSFLLRIYRQLLWKGDCSVERKIVRAPVENGPVALGGGRQR
ncbi:MAG: glycosyltransferase family 2 protein [Deltaproteobacteria bacterium]|nr:glycosyltransferase family 2 protein [Deltaproteobacteria bacterium]